MENRKMSLVMASLTVLSFIFGPRLPAAAEGKDEYRYEIQRSKAREISQQNMAVETKIGDFQTDKTITDFHGVRVRIEQYVLRPKPDQYKVVVYNTRATRSDNGYNLKTFNKDLPSDLSVLITNPTLSTGEPEYYEKAQEIRISNGQDYAEYLNENGQLYKDNYNRYSVIYQHEKLTVNDHGKLEIIRDGLSLTSKGLETVNVPNKNGDLEKLAVHDADKDTWSQVNWSIVPDLQGKAWGVDAHNMWQWTFVDNTFVSGEEVWINDDGKVLTRAQLSGHGLTADTWKSEIVKCNQEVIYKASEFEGRDIDLVWSPHSLWLQAYEKVVQK